MRVPKSTLVYSRAQQRQMRKACQAVAPADVRSGNGHDCSKTDAKQKVPTAWMESEELRTWELVRFDGIHRSIRLWHR